jgi:hypothetical protein
MVIDSDSLLDGVVHWVLGLTIGALATAVLLAAIVSVLGRHRFGLASIAMSLTLIIGVGVVAIVLNRARAGDATMYDGMWAIALAVASFLSGQRLLKRPLAPR